MITIRRKQTRFMRVWTLNQHIESQKIYWYFILQCLSFPCTQLLLWLHWLGFLSIN